MESSKMPRRSSELYLLPAMNGSGARVFKPPEGLSERPFDFAFNSIDFIASNPFLPLQFRIIETPALWNSPICRLALLELGLVLVLGFSWVCWGCIGSTVAPEILHIVAAAVAAVDVNPRWSSGSHPRISLNLLHPSITIGFGSEIIHTWYFFFLFCVCVSDFLTDEWWWCSSSKQQLYNLFSLSYLFTELLEMWGVLWLWGVCSVSV